MRVLLAAVGRLRRGPEAELTADYLARAGAAGRGVGLGPFDLVEVETKTAGDSSREAERLMAVTPRGAVTVMLDERGEAWSSRGLADRIGRWRDEGREAAVFWIGGPDGAAPELRARAAHILAFGVQTWPHRLVRVMAAEQLYRAASLLSGAPYHRD
jgi:23S rRNA (pseudouridine1915-N3)-methyltransferase